MATQVYTITLDSGSGAQTSIDTLYIANNGTGQSAYRTSTPSGVISTIEVPIWKNGAKSFSHYTYDNIIRIQNSGKINLYTGSITSPDYYFVEEDQTWTAVWTSTCPTFSISSDVEFSSELFYNSETGKWYSDYPFATEFTESSRLTIPRRTRYKFLGCYSTNSTQGTKYINADGSPTSSLLSLSPTEDVNAYALWELVSYKVTVKHDSGSPESTVFYAKVGATGTGRFYSDDKCTHQISSITPPSRELYAWKGAFSSSTQSAANTYINSEGKFQDLLYNLSITNNKTLSYANYWTQASYRITQYASSGWTYVRPKYYVKKTVGGVYEDWLCPEGYALSILPIPSKDGYRYIGSYSDNNTTSNLCVNKSGRVQSYLSGLQSNATIYPQGRAATYTLTLDPNGGTGGTSLYYDATSGDTAFFGTASSVVTSVTPPTYTGNSFLGYYTEQNGGTQVIDASGNILGTWAPSANGSVYAHWGIDVSIIDVDAGEGATEGTSRFWYKISTGKFYSDSELTQEISSITPPSKRMFSLNGIYTEGDVLAVSSSGVIQPGFLPSEEFVNLHATYTRRCYETKISAGGGTLEINSIYRAQNGTSWYSDENLTKPISNVGVPTRTGYRFLGFVYGGTSVISSSGDILPASVIDEDYTAAASWSAITYTLTFNGNGATPSFSSKSVTFGSAIGNLPTVSLSGRRFESWQVDGSDIKSTDIWLIGSNKTAVAKWKDNFGGLTDWFNLSNNYLMLVGSESGEGRKVTNLWNGSFEQGPGLVNPVCTYRIKSKGYVTIRLGKAFSSGFFITGFEYQTGSDREPLLVVSGTANEGVDAINLYDVTFQVDPDHIAQDPFGAVSGGGELVDLKSSATCDPVVPYENNRPCASDVVHGRKTVSGRTAAYFGENTPTFLNSFIDSGVPKSESDVDFTTYAFTAEREI